MQIFSPPNKKKLRINVVDARRCIYEDALIHLFMNARIIRGPLFTTYNPKKDKPNIFAQAAIESSARQVGTLRKRGKKIHLKIFR